MCVWLYDLLCVDGLDFFLVRLFSFIFFMLYTTVSCIILLDFDKRTLHSDFFITSIMIVAARIMA